MIESAGAASRTRDVVLIPCWRRPEFLWHCLENLLRAEGIERLHVIFRPDHGHDLGVLEVIGEFTPQLASFEIDVPPRCPYRRTKQSSNLLTGYLLAASRARDFVFMIEEDIMVARDFFRWHYAVQAAEPRLFCSLATRNTNRAVPVSDDPELYYRTSLDYCSLGVCFPRQTITQLIAPHVCRQYFEEPSRYCARHFPASRVGAGYVEQDGLIRRIQEAEAERSPLAYPYRARAFHAGFIGYHRGGRLRGALAERIEQVGRIIYNSDTMRQAIENPEHVADSIPIPLDTPPWQTLRHLPLPQQSVTPAEMRA